MQIVIDERKKDGLRTCYELCGRAHISHWVCRENTILCIAYKMESTGGDIDIMAHHSLTLSNVAHDLHGVHVRWTVLRTNSIQLLLDLVTDLTDLAQAPELRIVWLNIYLTS